MVLILRGKFWIKFDFMEKIIRIFVVNRKGGRETYAFNIDAFVSYNIDTHLLTLVGDSVFVHKDSEERLIEAYRRWGGERSVDESQG